MGNTACCFDPRHPNRQMAVDLQISSWSKLPNLYDYLGKDIYTFSSFSCKKDTLLLKHNGQWQAVTSFKDLRHIERSTIECYFDLSKQQGYFSLFNNLVCNDGLGNQSCWEVVQGSDQFRPGDVVRLGRLRLKLGDLVVDKVPDHSEVQIQTPNSCKVCYQRTSSERNPLISPCKCTGSVRYIHLDCLRHWTSKKFNVVSSDNVVYIPSGQITCQLCKSSYASVFEHEGHPYSVLYDMKVIKPPYIQVHVLQRFTNEIKLSYIISFDNKSTARIGRSNHCEIRTKDDISTSRVHSELEFRDNKLWIKNCQSKFGTLKLLRKRVEIVDSPCIKKYQIGNNLVEVQVKYSEADKEQDLEVNEVKSIRDSLVQSRVEAPSTRMSLESESVLLGVSILMT